MTDITDAKSWTVSSRLGAGSSLAMEADQGSVLLEGEVSPVEQLLAAIGACFAKSCSGVMQYHGLPSAHIEVSVLGHKPAGKLMDKGLDRIEISVQIAQDMSDDKLQMVLRDTKRVCTVTNSLSKEIDLLVSGSAGVVPS